MKFFKSYNFDEPWNGPNNRKLAHRMPKLFSMDYDKSDHMITNYLAVVGPETAWPGETILQLDDFKDGRDQTILLVEHQGSDVHWMEPRDLSFSEVKFQINVPGGFTTPYDSLQIVMVDGSTNSVEKTLPAENFRAMFTINGQE